MNAVVPTGKPKYRLPWIKEWKTAAIHGSASSQVGDAYQFERIERGAIALSRVPIFSSMRIPSAGALQGFGRRHRRPLLKKQVVRMA